MANNKFILFDYQARKNHNFVQEEGNVDYNDRDEDLDGVPDSVDEDSVDTPRRLSVILQNLGVELLILS